MNIEDLFEERNSKNWTQNNQKKFPITRAIFIDSTWHQTTSIYKDQRLKGIIFFFNYK